MNLIKFVTMVVIICFIFAGAMVTQVAQESNKGLNNHPTRQGPSISLLNSTTPIDTAPGSGGGGTGTF